MGTCTKCKKRESKYRSITEQRLCDKCGMDEKETLVVNPEEVNKESMPGKTEIESNIKETSNNSKEIGSSIKETEIKKR